MTTVGDAQPPEGVARPTPSPRPPAPALAFCPVCGSRLVEGRCAAHGDVGGVETADAPAPGVRPAGAARLAGRARALAGARARRRAAFVALACVTAAATAIAVDARVDAARLRDRVAAVEHDLGVVKALRDRVGAAEGGVNGLSRRVSDLEAAAAAHPDTATVAARVQASVFTVVSGAGEGSGWVVAAGRVVTNFHVVADDWVNGRRNVTLRQGDRSYPGTVVEAAAAADLAVIEFDGAGTAPLERAPERPRVGDAVLVVGSPLGLGGSVASGIVSAYRTEDGVEYLQFSAPISPGNSGGPVVDANGRVVGVAVAKFVGGGAEGLSFAIPVARVCDALAVC